MVVDEMQNKTRSRGRRRRTWREPDVRPAPAIEDYSQGSAVAFMIGPIEGGSTRSPQRSESMMRSISSRVVRGFTKQKRKTGLPS